MTRNYKYDVALSFSGKDREIARDIAQALQARGLKVFYDEWAKADLWGKDLFTRLHEIYLAQSRFCVPLLSQSYVESKWTKHELKSAQERSIETEEEYLLPIRIDDTEVPGLRSTIAYINYFELTADVVAGLIEEKVKSRPDIPTPPDVQSDVLLLSAPTAAEGFKRSLAGRDVRIVDDEIIARLENVGPQSIPKIRYDFASDLAKHISYKHQMSFHGPPYTAWRVKNNLFLSILPGVIYGEQKTLEFELYGSMKKKLAWVAEWSAVEDGWGPVGFDEYHNSVAGLSADRSGCSMFREPMILVLEKRGVAFRFPVAPHEGSSERFCEWLPVEASSLLYDWDRNPHIVRPQIGIWNTIYHEQTGEGILLFIVQGWWSNNALYTFEDALDVLLPGRYTRTPLRPGSMRMCVHLCNTPTDPGINKTQNPEQFDVDDILPTMKRVYSALARMTAADREIAVDPPVSAKALPQLSPRVAAAFQQAVTSLGTAEYPDKVKDWPEEIGDTNWVKLYHSPNYYFLGSREWTRDFSFVDVVPRDEILAYIHSCENL